MMFFMNETLINGQEVIIGDTKYIYEIDEYGRDTLKMYDEEFKVWGVLVFSKEETDSEERLIDALSNEYLKKFS
ncbi:hypothetical protein D3C87_1057220 [compost metagenome]